MRALACHLLGRMATVIALLGAVVSFAHAEERYKNPVAVVSVNRLELETPSGKVYIPVFSTRDLRTPHSDVTRAIIVIHGRLRNAGTYFETGLGALQAAGDVGRTTLLIAPQFLAEADIEGHKLPADTLRWTYEGWEGGEDAIAPAPVSSFDVLDAILARLNDKNNFPALTTVIVAGHSGGGQVVQRYAILGHGEDALQQRKIHVRYVVANPSSYAYFDNTRPDGAGSFSTPDKASCPAYDNWKYGMNALPRYAGKEAVKDLEAGYIKRDVIYLVGSEDTNPNHPALDKSCMAEEEGPTRRARAQAYFAYLQKRHPKDLTHHFAIVDGVGHNGDRMFASACGLSALFDMGGCNGS